MKVEHASPRHFRRVHIGPTRPRLVGLRARAGYGQASRRGARTRRAVAPTSAALRPYPSKTSRGGFHAAATGHHGASGKPALAEHLEPQGCADPDRLGERRGFAACRKAHTDAALGELGHAAAPWHQVGGADLGKRTHTIGDVGTGALIIEPRSAPLGLLRAVNLWLELCRKLGDDDGLKAAYRGGCPACQNLSERAIRLGLVAAIRRLAVRAARGRRAAAL